MYQEFKDININKTAIQGTLPEMPSRLLKQAYYAAISHIDEQFGFALDALEYVRRSLKRECMVNTDYFSGDWVWQRIRL